MQESQIRKKIAPTLEIVSAHIVGIQLAEKAVEMAGSLGIKRLVVGGNAERHIQPSAFRRLMKLRASYPQ